MYFDLKYEFGISGEIVAKRRESWLLEMIKTFKMGQSFFYLCSSVLETLEKSKTLLFRAEQCLIQ